MHYSWEYSLFWPFLRVKFIQLDSTQTLETNKPTLANGAGEKNFIPMFKGMCLWTSITEDCVCVCVCLCLCVCVCDLSELQTITKFKTEKYISQMWTMLLQGMERWNKYTHNNMDILQK